MIIAQKCSSLSTKQLQKDAIYVTNTSTSTMEINYTKRLPNSIMKKTFQKKSRKFRQSQLSLPECKHNSPIFSFWERTQCRHMYSFLSSISVFFFVAKSKLPASFLPVNFTPFFLFHERFQWVAEENIKNLNNINIIIYEMWYGAFGYRKGKKKNSDNFYRLLAVVLLTIHLRHLPTPLHCLPPYFILLYFFIFQSISFSVIL